MMKTVVEQCLIEALQALKASGELSENSVVPTIQIDRPKREGQGDLSANIAFLLAKANPQLPPIQWAARIIAHIPAHPSIARIEMAGAGFINFFMQQAAVTQVVEAILQDPAAFGQLTIGQSQKVLLEFVSANPTGPLHVGHGRGAAFGASLAMILKAAGFEVTTEYYVNDAGRQMDILAVSVWVRYLAMVGEPVVFPANGYQGDYVQAIAANLVDTQGEALRRDWQALTATLPPDAPEGGDKELYIDALIMAAKQALGETIFAEVHAAALQAVLTDIREDLADFGVTFDQWFSERSLFTDGAVDKAVAALKATGHTFTESGALWFRATAFDDEKDRVLIRENGQPTYFTSDVAYHWAKYERGMQTLFDVFGADHHGYVSRLRAAMRALSHDDTALRVLLVQFATLYRGDERVQMSTRSGSFVTLRELREEVGRDAARFFYVLRKPEQHMEFDLALAKSQSQDNPVYYVQYAHARICSVMRQLAQRGLAWDAALGLRHLSALTTPQEVALCGLLSRYREVLQAAAENAEPHLIAYYLKDLATALHSYYNAVVLLCDEEGLRAARLSLLNAVSAVLKMGLHLLGVSAPESM